MVSGMKASQDVLPDVTVSAWLNLSVDTDGKFRVEFDSFERVEAEGSIVSTAVSLTNGLMLGTWAR